MTDDSAQRLGEWLRERREELDIGLEQAEEDTRIRARYLEALEADDFDSLPDTVVGRGFLRNYATYLGLDSKRASDLYSTLVAPPEPESTGPAIVDGSSPFASGPFRPVPLHEVRGQRSRRGWIFGVLIIVVAVLGLLAWWTRARAPVAWIVDWFSGSETVSSPGPATATEQSVGVEPMTATHTAVATVSLTRTWTPFAPTGTERASVPTRTPTRRPSSTPTPTAPVYTGIFLELAFTEASWIQVTVDGVREFQGELEAGTYRSWFGDVRIELRIGNAGGVEITLNGQRLGMLGEPGEVVDRVFEKVGDHVGEVTVTPVTPLTPTEEPTLTATTPSPTELTPITPTLTISPTVTATATP